MPNYNRKKLDERTKTRLDFVCPTENKKSSIGVPLKVDKLEITCPICNQVHQLNEIPWRARGLKKQVMNFMRKNKMITEAQIEEYVSNGGSRSDLMKKRLMVKTSTIKPVAKMPVTKADINWFMEKARVPEKEWSESDFKRFKDIEARLVM